MDELLSATQLAQYLNLKPVTIRRKAKRGEIPAIRVGNRLRFNKQQIDDWLAQTGRDTGIRVLVVDDEPAIGKLFVSALDNRQYRVTATVSGAEALEHVNEEKYNIIFLDLYMPEMDGAELFGRIRLIDREVPVAIITGYPDTDMMARAMENGPFAVMKKPFTAQAIIDMVKSYSRSGEAANPA